MRAPAHAQVSRLGKTSHPPISSFKVCLVHVRGVQVMKSEWKGSRRHAPQGWLPRGLLWRPARGRGSAPKLPMDSRLPAAPGSALRQQHHLDLLSLLAFLPNPIKNGPSENRSCVAGSFCGILLFSQFHEQLSTAKCFL